MAATATVNIRDEGNATVFTVTPGGARRRVSLISLGGLFLWAAWSWRASLGSVLTFTSGAIGLGMLVIGLQDARPVAHRRQSVIRVSPDGFDVNGKLYPRASVKRLMVRNPLKTDEKPRVYVYNIYVSGDAGSGAPIITPNTPIDDDPDRLADGVYEIYLDANHKDNFIAGNLSKESVDRLMRSLCDTAGMVYQKG